MGGAINQYPSTCTERSRLPARCRSGRVLNSTAQISSSPCSAANGGRVVAGERIVIGDGERLEPERAGLTHQVARSGGAVRTVGMCVQIDQGDSRI